MAYQLDLDLQEDLMVVTSDGKLARRDPAIAYPAPCTDAPHYHRLAYLLYRCSIHHTNPLLTLLKEKP